MPVTPVDVSPFEVTDFSGGITDYYLNAPQNKYSVADNLLIVKHGDEGKLFTRPGSEIYDATNYQIPSGAQRVGSLRYFNFQLFVHSARKFFYISAGSWVTLEGPTSNEVFPSGISTTTAVSMAQWNKHLLVTNSDFSRVQKIYKDGSNVWQLRTAGMPTPTSPIVTAGASGSESYLYRFLFAYTYVVENVTYLDRGATVEVRLSSTASPDYSSVVITALQVLANGSTDNYDTGSTNLKIEIYRTTTNGVNFFKAGSVNNGTTTFSDSMSDATLQTQEPLYTEDGSPENTQPPLCKYVHVLDDQAYYANVKIGSENFANRVYQSIPGDVDSVPVDFFVDLQEDVTAISSITDNPIVFCTNFIYRLNGAYDGLGAGFIVPQRISDTAGCVSAQSVVQTLVGVFWAGIDGFYLTDGFQVQRISREIDQTYLALVSSDERKRRIIGAYDRRKNRVYWTVQKGTAATDCDVCFVLDLNYAVSDNMPLTTISGGANFAPTAITFIDQNLVRGDSRGYVFIHRDTLYVDPKVDVTTPPTNWHSSTIIYDYVSAATNFGTTIARKFVPRITLDCKNETNLSLQIISINDDKLRTANLNPIRSRGNLVWGEPDVYWGDHNIIWNFAGLIDGQRRFPAKSLRCQYKQVEFTNAEVAIINSDILGTATVNSVLKTATLDNTALYDWPTHSVDYYIAFANDGYVTEYLVTNRTADVLTFVDVLGRAPSGSYAWVIRGKPKGEVLLLLSYVMHYGIFGKTSQMFRSDATGEVGT